MRVAGREGRVGSGEEADHEEAREQSGHAGGDTLVASALST